MSRHSTSRISADRHGNALSRATVEQVDDTQFMQEMKAGVFAQEMMDQIEHVHPYGFSAVPQKPDMMGGIKRAAEAFFSFLGGNRAHGVVMVTGDRRFRLYKMQPGEVGLHDDQGHQIHITRSGVFVSAPKSKKIVGQIMNDDTLPQDSGPTGAASSSAQNGQIPQAGRQTFATFQMDQNSFTVSHPTAINLTAPTITLNGTCHLGGTDANTPAAMQGSTDTNNDSITGNLATKVFVK